MKILFENSINGWRRKIFIDVVARTKKKKYWGWFFCTRQHNNHEIIDYFTTHFKQFDIPVYICTASSSISLKAAHSFYRIIKNEKYTLLSAHLIHAEIISVLSKILIKTNCHLVTTKHGYLQKFMDVHELNYKKLNKLSFSYLVEKFLQYFFVKTLRYLKGWLIFIRYREFVNQLKW